MRHGLSTAPVQGVFREAISSQNLQMEGETQLITGHRFMIEGNACHKK